MAAFDFRKARQYLEDREKARQTLLAERLKRAQTDAQKIISTIQADYHPRRIFQWGSLVDTGKFTENSDIDIAVEGITDGEVFFRLLGDAMGMTDFPLDIVQLEKIEPEFRWIIEHQGVLVYEAE